MHTTDKNLNLAELKQEYRKQEDYNQLKVNQKTQDEESFRRRLRDTVGKFEVHNSLRSTTAASKTNDLSEPSINVVKQDSYDLLSANEIQSPVGILMKSITRTIRRMKNKGRDGS